MSRTLSRRPATAATKRSTGSLPTCVHAHERPQGVHVRVDGEGPTEEDRLDRRAHLLQQAPPHADPAFAAGQRLRHLRHAHAVDRKQIDEEAGLLQNPQRLVRGGPQQMEDARRLFRAQRCVGHASDPQLVGGAAAFEAVQEEPRCGRVHPFQRFFDAALGDRRQRRASRAGSRRRWPSYRRSKLDSSTFSYIESALRRVLVEKSENVIDPAAGA